LKFDRADRKASTETGAAKPRKKIALGGDKA